MQSIVSDVLSSPKWPAEWPYSANDFSRQDETFDEIFYSMPRFCYHVDERAIVALESFYATEFAKWENPPDVLDICSSHVSHFPRGMKLGKSVALGMNEAELKENEQVDEWVVRDLNESPSLPFEENSFDVVTCCVSIDYLTRPREICEEVGRVLKPGGKAFFALSNRCFPTKAVNIWLRTNDLEHVFITGSFFHYSGSFEAPKATEISHSPQWRGGTSLDVAYLSVVEAEKKKV